jgi:two-component system chemotaxis response regulator CheB
MSNEVRVLVVDDSAVARHTITNILTKGSERIKIVGTAPNGKIALNKMTIPKYQPDIVTMDIMMPEMDGFETISHIMDRFPLPVVIVSSLSQKEVDKSISTLGMAALESGYVEFVKKPDPKRSMDETRFKRELVDKIVNFSKMNLTQAIKSFDIDYHLKERPILVKKPRRVLREFKDKIYVIASSTGGTRAIKLILPKVPKKFPPIVIIQHMVEEMVNRWVEGLRDFNPHLNIKIPDDGEYIRPNNVYIAPGGKHCAIREGKRFNIYKGSKINFLMPSADVTFATAADVYGENTLGIILTGMGKDGFEGAKTIKAVKGKIIAEHKSTCVIYGMPKWVIEDELVDSVAPLHKIPELLVNYSYNRYG